MTDVPGEWRKRHHRSGHETPSVGTNRPSKNTANTVLLIILGFLVGEE